MSEHLSKHKPKVSKHLNKPPKGDAPATPPAELFRKAKEKATKRNPLNRGAPTKNPSAEEILRAKKKSIARKK